MDVVTAGAAVFVSPSNAFQLSASSLSIGTVLITRPDVELSAGTTAQGLALKLQETQQVNSGSHDSPPLVLVNAEVFKGVGLSRELDVYL